ncbi:MAG: hypothetical protein PHT77_05420 [Bacteroidales bacterium]|nr:hypothetical protein [Bacteroidales bacterium]
MRNTKTNEWLSGKIVDGKGIPTMTSATSYRYEYDTFDQADDVITELYNVVCYTGIAKVLEVVEV